MEEMPEPRGRRLNSFIPASSRSSSVFNNKQEHYLGWGRCRFKAPSILMRLGFFGTIDPQGKLYQFWLFLVTLAFMYNAAAIPLRAAFTKAKFYKDPNIYSIVCNDTRNGTAMILSVTSDVNTTSYLPTVNQNSTPPTSMSENFTSPTTMVPTTVSDTPTSVNACRRVYPPDTYYEAVENDNNRVYWWIIDYFCDLLYILDILLVKNRVKFVKNGLYELDILSLAPLDILYLIPSLNYNTLVRLPRLLKVQTFWEFYDRMDQASSSAHIIRVLRTMTYMLFLIHIEACGYFAVSAMENLRSNDWVYDGRGTAYVRCLYLATKTATSIGNNPKPENELEYMFMTVYWLSGVFVFALLIGQIRDIFQSATQAKSYYRKTMDQTIYYMQSFNLPAELQGRVRMWFNYNWEHQKTLNENSLLEALPKKLKADLAINVHFKTLSKVNLFADCDKNLLFDLVLKLRPCLYLPGDYICKKGEIGTEMYIVKTGQVEVVGGPNNSLVFATLHEGSVFGEISLLALAGGNRRTADVRSKGYSQIFILSKDEFEEAMRDYPDAQMLLRKRAKKLLKINAKHAEATKKMESEEIIKSRQGTPKLLKTVVQVVDPKSHIHEYLSGKKRRDSETGEHGQSGSKDQDEEIFSDASDEVLVIEQTESPIVSKEEIKQKSSEVKDEKESVPKTELIVVKEGTPPKETKDTNGKPKKTIKGSAKVADINNDVVTKVADVGQDKGTPMSSSDFGSILNSSPHSTPKKTPLKTPDKAQNVNEDDYAEILQSPPPSRPVSAARPFSRIRNNKVGVKPDNTERKENGDKEHIVTIDVQVHREKTMSPRDGDKPEQSVILESPVSPRKPPLQRAKRVETQF